MSVTVCMIKFSTALTLIWLILLYCDEQDQLVLSIFESLYKRFNRDTAHTTKCSSSVSPHSSPDLPAIPRQRRKVETKGEAGRL